MAAPRDLIVPRHITMPRVIDHHATWILFMPGLPFPEVRT